MKQSFKLIVMFLFVTTFVMPFAIDAKPMVTLPQESAVKNDRSLNPEVLEMYRQNEQNSEVIVKGFSHSNYIPRDESVARGVSHFDHPLFVSLTIFTVFIILLVCFLHIREKTKSRNKPKKQ